MCKKLLFQLISRHLSTSDREVTLSLTIPENGWMNNQGFKMMRIMMIRMMVVVVVMATVVVCSDDGGGGGHVDKVERMIA